MGGGCLRQRVLFRAGWKHIFCIPGFENVSPGNGSDWVKETHCAVKAEWKFIFFGFMIFYILFCFSLYFYYICVKFL